MLLRAGGVVLALSMMVPLGCESDPPRPTPTPPLVVRPDGSGDYPTLQAAIDAAEVGNIIELTDGTFRGEGNRDIDFRGKSITVRSRSGDPASCIIDCRADSLDPHRAFYFHSDESEEAQVEGVTITGGYASAAGITCCGGAVLCVGRASPTFETCWFLDNSSSGMGGAVQCGAFGGGDTGCAPVFNFCVFAGNTSGSGGAMAVWAGRPVIENCTFAYNTAVTMGGAIDYYALVQMHINNTIIAFNSGTCAVNVVAPGSGGVGCSDVFGNQGGDWIGYLAELQNRPGNISADPMFRDAGAGVFRLDPQSPCCPYISACGLIGALPADCP